MKTILIIFLCLLAVPSFASQTHVYIAQSSAGSDDGSSCANAHSLAWINSSGNWGSGATQVGAGTTVHLCGTLTITAGNDGITAYGSGSAGSPITFYFETGSGMTSDAAAYFFNLGSYNYITIDGNNTSPSVTCTDNGTEKTYTGEYRCGTIGSSGSHLEFKNLNIGPMYVRVGTEDKPNWGGGGIDFAGSYISIHDCTFSQARTMISAAWPDGSHDAEIYNCTFDKFNWGIGVGITSAGELYNLFIHNNTFGDMGVWDDTTENSYHHNGIIIANNYPTANIHDYYIYNNDFHGTFGTFTTAYVYANTGIRSLYVFNNLFRYVSGTGYLFEAGYSGALHETYPDTNHYVVNNYFDVGTTGAFNCSYINGFYIENNIFDNVPATDPIVSLTDNTMTVDYNLYENRASLVIGSAESHSINTSDLRLDANFSPYSDSQAVNHGYDFSGLSITALNKDKAGNDRVGNWDIGAYEYVGVSGTYPTVKLGGGATIKLGTGAGFKIE